MTIRQATLAMLVLAATIAGPSLAQSQGATTVVVPFPAGGALDSVARIVTQALNDRTKASYIVDNRPGANGMIGARDVAKARPNGATWLMADGAAVTINPFLYPNDKSFDAEKELRPVRALASQGLVLVVRAGFPAKSIKDFVELARTRDLTYASAGVGSGSHLAMAYFSSVAGGLKFTHVPYRGGPSLLQAIVAGEVDVGFVAVPNALPFIRKGTLVALGVSTAARSRDLPDVPTMIESGYANFVVDNRYFVWLPAGTPDAVARSVDTLVESVLSDPRVMERIRATGLDLAPPAMGEMESRKWLLAERETWQRVIRDNHIKTD
jgi:tripartite-type tricarboxylate transporter receptor subunit TctC